MSSSSSPKRSAFDLLRCGPENLKKKKNDRVVESEVQIIKNQPSLTDCFAQERARGANEAAPDAPLGKMQLNAPERKRCMGRVSHRGEMGRCYGSFLASEEGRTLCSSCVTFLEEKAAKEQVRKAENPEKVKKEKARYNASDKGVASRQAWEDANPTNHAERTKRSEEKLGAENHAERRKKSNEKLGPEHVAERNKRSEEKLGPEHVAAIKAKYKRSAKGIRARLRERMSDARKLSNARYKKGVVGKLANARYKRGDAGKKAARFQNAKMSSKLAKAMYKMAIGKRDERFPPCTFKDLGVFDDDDDVRNHLESTWDDDETWMSWANFGGHKGATRTACAGTSAIPPAARHLRTEQ